MTGKVAATANWHRLDGPGEDSCRLVQEPDGWLLSGHARFGSGSAASALDYIVRCDSGWCTASADIAGVFEGREVSWRLLRSGDGWQLNGAEQGLQGCIDIDLAFTPATNLLPLRRLAPADGERADLSAAWFRPEGGGSLTPLVQSYTRLDSGKVGYASPGFRAGLEVHSCGFVTLYEGLWEGKVNAGP